MIDVLIKARPEETARFLFFAVIIDVLGEKFLPKIVPSTLDHVFHKEAIRTRANIELQYKIKGSVKVVQDSEFHLLAGSD